MKKYKVYVGCGLTHAPQMFKDSIEALKEKMRKIEGVEVLCFLDVIEGTCRDVYNHDINSCIRECDMFVAILDEPSTGLGYELAVQLEDRKKPALGLAHRSCRVTRLVLDPDVSGYEFKRYEDICEDGFEIIHQHVVADMIKIDKKKPSFVTPELNLDHQSESMCATSILGDGH
jgi:hypothetical protein